MTINGADVNFALFFTLLFYNLAGFGAFGVMWKHQLQDSK